VLYCCVELAAGLLVESELLDVGVVVESSLELSVVAASCVVSRGDTVVGPPWDVSSENWVVVWKLLASVVKLSASVVKVSASVVKVSASVVKLSALVAESGPASSEPLYSVVVSS